jgi:hypothetical protein
LKESETQRLSGIISPENQKKVLGSCENSKSRL